MPSLEDSLFEKVVNYRVHQIICYSVVVRSVNTIEIACTPSYLGTLESCWKFMPFDTLGSHLLDRWLALVNAVMNLRVP